jgi:hypothetical protein
VQTKFLILAGVFGVITGLCFSTNQNILLSVGTALISAFLGLSALLSKDKKDKQIEEIHTITTNNNEIDHLKEAIKAHKDKGTPKYYIDTLEHLSLSEKAKLFDDSVLASRGRPAKNNPYKG